MPYQRRQQGSGGQPQNVFASNGPFGDRGPSALPRDEETRDPAASQNIFSRLSSRPGRPHNAQPSNAFSALLEPQEHSHAARYQSSNAFGDRAASSTQSALGSIRNPDQVGVSAFGTQQGVHSRLSVSGRAAGSNTFSGPGGFAYTPEGLAGGSGSRAGNAFSQVPAMRPSRASARLDADSNAFGGPRGVPAQQTQAPIGHNAFSGIAQAAVLGSTAPAASPWPRGSAAVAMIPGWQSHAPGRPSNAFAGVATGAVGILQQQKAGSSAFAFLGTSGPGVSMQAGDVVEEVLYLKSSREKFRNAQKRAVSESEMLLWRAERLELGKVPEEPPPPEVC